MTRSSSEKGEVIVAMTFPWLSFLPETSLSQIFELEIHAYTIDVHKPIIMSFGLAQLREAAEKYTYHTTLGAEPSSI